MPLPPGLQDAALTDGRPPARHIFYLHGFASSAGSTKAGYFADQLKTAGITLHCPDFNGPDFATLTMSRMLGQLSAELDGLPPGPVTLIGSSLGGALAILAAERFNRVTGLVLLAPAVMFAKPGHHLLPPDRIEQWRRDRSMAFFHYAYGEERRLNFEFYEDSLVYAPMDAMVAQPCLIYQGKHDTSVDYRTVDAFARQRPHVRLTLLEDDHSLMTSLPRIWSDARAFLEAP